METSHHYHVSFSQVFSVKFLPKSIDSIKFCFPNILIDDGEIYLSSMYRLIVTMPNICDAYFLYADIAP